MDVSGHNNYISIGYQQFDLNSVMSLRAKVVVDVLDGNIGLFSFTRGLLNFADAVKYTAESFYDLLYPDPSLTNSGPVGIEDEYENCLLPNHLVASTEIPNFFGKYPLAYSTLGVSIPRFALVSIPLNGGQNAIGLASASSQANARQYLGAAVGQVLPASPQIGMLHRIWAGRFLPPGSHGRSWRRCCGTASLPLADACGIRTG